MALPDGRIQTVTYSVRPETGYVVSVPWQIPQIETSGAIMCGIRMWSNWRIFFQTTNSVVQEYSYDEHSFQAEVTYTGEASFGPEVGGGGGGGAQAEYGAGK